MTMPAFPLNDFEPPRHTGPLPDRVDTVIVGGGVIGVMTAWFLAEAGQSVLICEKGRIAAEQSSRNWGWVRQQGRDAAELPIMVESMELWADMAQGFGDALGFQRTGVLYTSHDEAEVASYEAWLPHARDHEVDSRLLSSREIAQMFPDAAPAWRKARRGGLWTPSDARAEPWRAVPLIAQTAAENGVIIRENCAVRGLDVTAGQISGVVTEAGLVACDQVVVAAGAWSRLFLGRHGVKIPQLAVRASVAATTPLPELFAGAAIDGKLALRRRDDGGYTLAPAEGNGFFIGPNAFRSLRTYLPVLKQGFSKMKMRPMAPRHFPDAWDTPRRWGLDKTSPFERMRVLNPAPDLKLLEELRQCFQDLFPGVGEVGFAAQWAGMIDAMPDVVPVVDQVSALPGLTIATGMSGHGFGIGPGMGQVVSRLVLGERPGHDLRRFRLSRFSDGSKLVPGPAI